ncbi:MAG: sialate O-acetylesterase [Bacteroides sp.]
MSMLIMLVFINCSKTTEKRIVLAIPVYGQSLALGEEAIRITDFDSLSEKCGHRVVTENMDEKFGYFSENAFKQWTKRIVRYKKRSFELSIYGMAEAVTQYWQKEGTADSLMICTFPGGQGATGILGMSKGSKAYQKFINEIEGAYQKAKSRDWDFIVPAVCWMQGEDDIVWDRTHHYKRDLKQFQLDLSQDVKALTKQRQEVAFICYQTNCLTLSKQFDANAFNCREVQTPQALMELVRGDTLFLASGPTYPYSFARERVHIDGLSQKRLGYLAGLSVIRLLQSKPSKGLTPAHLQRLKNTVLIDFNIPYPPLTIDTLEVFKAAHYGFSVIDSSNTNILQQIFLKDNQIKLCCKKSPIGCRVRYAVNGQKEKSGYRHGPRGNIRDSQGNKFSVTIHGKSYPLHNWCYQFDILIQ